MLNIFFIGFFYLIFIPNSASIPQFIMPFNLKLRTLSELMKHLVDDIMDQNCYQADAEYELIFFKVELN